MSRCPQYSARSGWRSYCSRSACQRKRCGVIRTSFPAASASAFAARALALNPKVIIADESVSALDVSVQAQVLTLLEDLRQRYRLSYLFISHDMAVVERICHRVAVMFGGQLVEIGPRDRVLHHPQHPYTQHLLSAVPIPDVQQRRQPRATSAMPIRPEPIKPIGYQRVPQRFTDFGDGHLVAC